MLQDLLDYIDGISDQATRREICLKLLGVAVDRLRPDEARRLKPPANPAESLRIPQDIEHDLVEELLASLGLHAACEVKARTGKGVPAGSVLVRCTLRRRKVATRVAGNPYEVVLNYLDGGGDDVLQVLCTTLVGAAIERLQPYASHVMQRNCSEAEGRIDRALETRLVVELISFLGLELRVWREPHRSGDGSLLVRCTLRRFSSEDVKPGEPLERKIGCFEALDSDGAEHVIEIWQLYADGTTRRDLRTADGRAVSRLGQGRYEIVAEGITLTSDDPAAP